MPLSVLIRRGSAQLDNRLRQRRACSGTCSWQRTTGGAKHGRRVSAEDDAWDVSAHACSQAQQHVEAGDIADDDIADDDITLTTLRLWFSCGNASENAIVSIRTARRRLDPGEIGTIRNSRRLLNNPTSQTAKAGQCSVISSSIGD